MLGRPAFTLVVTLLVFTWISLNLALEAIGRHAPDLPPFGILSDVAAMAAVFMTSMILATQRRKTELSSHREQLTWS
jgi:uncharacterized membrane protein